MDSSYGIIAKEEMEDFFSRCMIALGTKESHAKVLANCLITADYRGHFSHGLNKLYLYMKDVKEGIINFNDEPKILKESGATAWVDGMNLLGPVVGNFCMNLAIEKAKTCGIGMVVAKRSNHYGIAGYYSLQAVKQELIGLSFTNTSPVVVPTRAKNCALGTNPITFAAPGKDGDSFELDMATSAVAFGKVELAHRKNTSIPPIWGTDKNGIPTENPEDIITDGGLLPLGGVEESSGYKGYGLAFLVEILCGILAGSSFGPHIRDWKKNWQIADLGQCFIAINPSFFADEFEDRLQNLMNHCRQMEPVNKDKPVLIPGDPEKEHMKRSDENEGIAYHENQIKYAYDIANELGIKAPEIKNKIEKNIS